MKRAILLLSGGLDSAVTGYYAQKRVSYTDLIALFFDYGQRARKEELYYSKKLARALHARFMKIELPWLQKLSTSHLTKHGVVPKTSENDLASGRKSILDWWVPCRNAIFLVNALAVAESLYLEKKQRYDILIGLKHEGSVHMKDTTERFVEQMNLVAEEATHHGNYTILAPLISLDKPEVIQLGKELHVPFQYTYSCYAGFSGKQSRTHCGVCLNCMLRKKGFYWAGIRDPTQYTSRTTKRFINKLD